MTWRALAACHGTDTEDWFPTLGPGRGGRRRAAAAFRAHVDRLVAICDRCPVQAECLTDALDHDDVGVRGGTTEEQRRFMRGRS